MEKSRSAHLDEGIWVWEGNELYDRHGVLLAHVTADVLTIGQTRLLLEHSTGTVCFRLRATSPAGAFGTLRQSGMTVTHLVGCCSDRHYFLDRVSFFRKERYIKLADGTVAAIVKPQLNGSVQVHDGPGYGELPVIDSIFLSWGCVLVDAPWRRTRI